MGYEFARYHLDNQNLEPGSHGIDEGFLIGAVVFSFGTPVLMPADTDNLALKFHFKVREDVSPTTTELKFINGGTGLGQPLTNVVTVRGLSASLEVVQPEIVIGSLIIGEVTTFVRGDSNGDGTVNIADPSFTLGHLFLGGRAPTCKDAADANDDGRLDVSDPIATLDWLFLGSRSLPPPNGTPQTDPTPDSLGCIFGTP